MRKRQICVQVDERIARNMEKIRDETGIPISRQIELKLKGFEIRRSARISEEEISDEERADIHEIREEMKRGEKFRLDDVLAELNV